MHLYVKEQCFCCRMPQAAKAPNAMAPKAAAMANARLDRLTEALATTSERIDDLATASTTTNERIDRVVETTNESTQRLNHLTELTYQWHDAWTRMRSQMDDMQARPNSSISSYGSNYEF
jgi:chromosome segregation ATPase